MRQDPYLPPGVTDRDLDDAATDDELEPRCGFCGHEWADHVDRSEFAEPVPSAAYGCQIAACACKEADRDRL